MDGSKLRRIFDDSDLDNDDEPLSPYSSSGDDSAGQPLVFPSRLANLLKARQVKLGKVLH